MTFAVCFPGQGSQSVGMSTALAAEFPLVKELYAEASEALGYDLWALVADDTDGQLNTTEFTQPALLAAGYATWQAWVTSGGAAPVAFAGHSLGEYTALVAAGALSFADGVRLVRARGQAMQAAVPAGAGAMAAVIGLDDEKVAQACAAAAEGDVLSPVNFNAPGQVVAAGTKAAIARLGPVAKELGARMVKELPVSVPSHCALMQPAAEALGAALADITVHAPAAPVIHNVDAAARTEAEAIKDALVRQVMEPVQWVQCVQALQTKTTTLVEFGPGKVLTGLNKRIDRTLTLASVGDADQLRAFQASLQAAL